MTRATLAAALTLVLAAPAAAQEAPRLTPARDVAVTYRITGAGPVQSMRWSWLTAQQIMRMDIDSSPGWILINTRDQSAVVVMEQQRMAMRLPREQVPDLGPNGLGGGDGARFTRLGTETIAGVACTNWQVSAPQGETEACLTADGVLLRGRAAGGQPGVVEATEVRYGGLDTARFRVPEGTRVMDMPAGMPGGPPRR